MLGICVRMADAPRRCFCEVMLVEWDPRKLTCGGGSGVRGSAGPGDGVHKGAGSAAAWFSRPGHCSIARRALLATLRIPESITSSLAALPNHHFWCLDVERFAQPGFIKCRVSGVARLTTPYWVCESVPLQRAVPRQMPRTVPRINRVTG